MENLKYWVRKISEEFYELVYEDEWLKNVFRIDKKIITSQQTDFMIGALGGEKRYGGKNPGDAHPHIFVSEKMWNHRETLLIKAMDTTGAPQDIKERWLKIDNAFKRFIVMKDPQQCKKRFFTDEIIVVDEQLEKSA